MLCVEDERMAQHQDLDFPHVDLPSYLRGLEPPVTTEDALEYAERHGAPQEALDFIESLPAAVFTSVEGMHHAFSSFALHGIPESDPEHVLVGQDGTSS
jgi:hypothetical protein